MTSARSLITPEAIREASLPKSMRGFDEAATRKFLTDVAETVQRLMVDRDELRQALEERKQQARVDPEDPAAIGNVLLAAQRAGEELVAHAHATAEQITRGAEEASARMLEETRVMRADAEREIDERRDRWEHEHARLRDELQHALAEVEAERQRIIAQARAEAEELVAQGHERLEALVVEEQRMSDLVARRRKEFADMLQAALEQVDHPDETSDDTEPELTTVLKSRVSDRELR